MLSSLPSCESFTFANRKALNCTGNSFAGNCAYCTYDSEWPLSGRVPEWAILNLYSSFGSHLRNIHSGQFPLNQILCVFGLFKLKSFSALRSHALSQVLVLAGKFDEIHSKNGWYFH